MTLAFPARGRSSTFVGSRTDLGSLTPTQTREVLELAHVSIACEIKRQRQVLRLIGSLDADDLHSIGQAAALEAAVTHDASRGTQLRTWIAQCVRWRIAEAVQVAGDVACRETELTEQHSPPSTSEGGSITPSGRRNNMTHRHAMNDEDLVFDPTETYELLEMRAWVEREMRGLTPRQKILLVQRLANVDESDAELARSFGVDRSQVCRDFEVAIAKLAAKLGRRVPSFGVQALEAVGEMASCA